MPRPIRRLDVGGGDTAHKLALLAAWRSAPRPTSTPCRWRASTTSCRRTSPSPATSAIRIKLLGDGAKKTPQGIDQRVHPAMVRAGTPLGDVDSVFNGVVVDAGAAGQFFFEGRGAGEAPTAAAVIADIVEIARGTIGPVFGRPAALAGSASPAPTG